MMSCSPMVAPLAIQLRELNHAMIGQATKRPSSEAGHHGKERCKENRSRGEKDGERGRNPIPLGRSILFRLRQFRCERSRIMGPHGGLALMDPEIATARTSS